ncbi:MAG: NUDIX hydrolase [Flavobacteriales bacterium]
MIPIDSLKKKLKQPLPGIEAHLKMTPYRALTKTIPQNYRESAVLVLLYNKEDELYFPVIQRQDYKGVHSNQISFPGGKKEEIDNSLLETALRETEEEIGILQSGIEVIGELTQIYIPPSNFMVNVFLAFYEDEPNFVREEKEVKEIIEIPLSAIMDEKRVKETEVLMQGGLKLKTPYLDLENKVVWGATAAVLAELKEIILSFEKN